MNTEIFEVIAISPKLVGGVIKATHLKAECESPAQIVAAYGKKHPDCIWIDAENKAMLSFDWTYYLKPNLSANPIPSDQFAFTYNHADKDRDITMIDILEPEGRTVSQTGLYVRWHVTKSGRAGDMLKTLGSMKWPEGKEVIDYINNTPEAGSLFNDPDCYWEAPESMKSISPSKHKPSSASV